ncbi:site-specific integrase [Caldinitratiruptor microaerophilus]|uniref:Site-specific integrase n=1 Tax=Caldinitratiruptor microaerophilus TaxID=671077 RepID=A0AA35CPB4_9FIRM|nr:site-specific integrase [Caldinitratiruptor microaerophilus]BDG62318.1 site-specific integrase [Caldinitratiruptor microaerophilus]
MPRKPAPRKDKAGNGEGSVWYHEKRKRWYCELTIGWEQVIGPDGKPVLDENGVPKTRRKVARFSDPLKTKVVDWKLETLQKIREGTLVEPSRETLGQFLARWLETTVAHEVKATTLQNYQDIVRAYIAPHIGAVPLQKITPPQVQGLYHTLLGAGKSPRTVALVHAVLHKALRQAVEWGLLARNPIDAVKKPRVERKEAAALTPEQVAQFLEAARDDRLHALFTLAVYTGLRQGELFGLRWRDIDLEAGTVTVAQNLQWIGGKPVFSTPKTRTSRRTIDLAEPAVAALKQWRIEQARELLKIGLREPELVFTTEIGTPLNPSNVRNRHLPEILAKAGLPKIRFHDLRHTFVTNMIDAGVDLKTVSELAGHSQVQVTADIYRHVFRRQKKDAVERLGALFTAAQKKNRA